MDIKNVFGIIGIVFAVAILFQILFSFNTSNEVQSIERTFSTVTQNLQSVCSLPLAGASSTFFVDSSEYLFNITIEDDNTICLRYDSQILCERISCTLISREIVLRSTDVDGLVSCTVIKNEGQLSIRCYDRLSRYLGGE